MRSNDKRKLELIFLLIYIPLSLMMMAIMPITRTADENAHLLQAFVIADGQLFSSYAEKSIFVPENLYIPKGNGTLRLEDLQTMADEHLSETRVHHALQTSTAIYPPISYFPQAAGMFICRLFTDNLLALLYSARIANWLCVSMILWAAFKMLPHHRMLFIFLAVLPMNLQQMISASADGLIIALTYALTAFVLYCMEAKPVFSWKHYGLMTALALGVSHWKVFYTPMLLLLLFIPPSCFGTQKRKRLGVWVTIGTMLALLAAWVLVCYLIMFKGAQSGLEGQTMSGVSRFLTQPTDFIVKLFSVIKRYLPSYIVGIFGYRNYFSWLNVGPGLPLTLASAATLGLFLFADDGKTLAKPYRIGSFAMGVSCVLLGFFMLYLWWTPAQSPMIEGFQARYLLPLLFAFALAFWHQPKRTIRNQTLLLLAVVAVNVGYLYQIFVQVR